QIESAAATILILNKSDLPHASVPNAHEISCLTGAGIEELKERIKDLVFSGRASADMSDVMINSRHEQALQRARAGISNTIEAFEQGRSIELAAMDLRIAVNAG